MTLADKAKRLARIIPGVAGYQDRETSRDTDKAVRVRLAHELEGIKLAIEKVKRQLMEEGDLSLLPDLDRIASRLDKNGNAVRYASRGYSGIFDTERIDAEKVDRLYAFDLKLIEDLEEIRRGAADLGGQPDRVLLKSAVRGMEDILEGFERKVAARQKMSGT